MRSFRYARAGERAEALALATDPGAKYLGGGTNLVDLMKVDVEQPALLIDLRALGLDRIEPLAGGGLRIGASVRNTDLAADARVRAEFPVLAAALLAGASTQLRNLATVGGNLLQRTRCPYFQDVTKPCNKRQPGSGCPARVGANRELAILGASEHCVATHPSDMAVALAALDARIQTDHRDGPQTFGLDEFYRLPGDRPERDTNLPAGALIVGVDVPPLPPGARSSYRKVRDRDSFGFALVSVAVVLEMDGDRIATVRLAFGGVAHKPWRARVAEAQLAGARVDPDAISQAMDAELAAARPLAENAFKVPLARRVAVRALTALAEATS